MGFRQRERKRTKNAAMNAARAVSRKTGSSSPKWWLTLAKRKTCCARCGGILRVGREMVYRASPREALRRLRGIGSRDQLRPSVAWERKRKPGPSS